MSSDSSHLLADERAAAQAEAAATTADQALWERARLVDADPAQAKVQGVIDRITAIETAGFPSADLTRAKTVLESALKPDAPLAVAERSTATGARQAAVRARDAAVKALAAAINQADATRQAQKKELMGIELLIADLESRKSAGSDAVKTEMVAAFSPAPADAPWSPELSVDTPLFIPSVNPPKPPPAAKAAPPPPPPPAPKAAPPPPAKAAPPPPPPAPKAAPPPPPPPAAKPQPMVAAAPSMTTGTMRKLSKRRRVRVAPPPKKLDVEVATYGDNTFYTGFDNKIASGGLFVTSLETLPTGHELDLTIDLDGKPIKVRGKVEFTRLDNPSNPECSSGAGIKLLNLPGDAAASIESFFKEREPLFISPAR